MAKEINTSIKINATPQEVWNVLTDFEKYAEWNPFVKSITGEVKVGNEIKVELDGMTFKPTILTFDHASEFKWLGHLWVKGLFDGEHKFRLIDNEDGTTEFHHSERFNGILVSLFSKSLDEKTKKGFERMNEELKQRVEKE